MRTARRWLVWAWGRTDDSGRRAKVPFYVHGGKRGDTDTAEDTARLASYDEASAKLAVLPFSGFAGLGFALGDGWQGIDFDSVRANELGALANACPSYIELSPSGRGCHAIGYGASFDSLSPNRSGLEAYCGRRFFTFTGHVIRPGPLCCLAAWVAQHVAPRHTSSGSGHGGRPIMLLDAPADGPQQLSDDEVMARFWNARNAERFRALWHGDMRAYGNDHSKADQALVTQLAFYTLNNEQLVRLWRASALGQRDKVYRRNRDGVEDYVLLTVTRARSTHAPRLRREAALAAAMPALEAALFKPRAP